MDSHIISGVKTDGVKENKRMRMCLLAVGSGGGGGGGGGGC